jgi:hypothetical protein
MSDHDSQVAALLTAAVLEQHKIPLTADGAEKVVVFHKHIVFFLKLHLQQPETDRTQP